MLPMSTVSPLPPLLRWGNHPPKSSSLPPPPEDDSPVLRQLAQQLNEASPNKEADLFRTIFRRLAQEFSLLSGMFKEPPPPLSLGKLSALTRWGACQVTPNPEQPLYTTKLWSDLTTRDFKVSHIEASKDHTGAFEISNYVIDHTTGQVTQAQRTVLKTSQSSLPDVLNSALPPNPIREILAPLGYKEPE